MKIVLQRVNRASVTVDGEITGSINKGYLVLLGVGAGDDKAKIEKAVDKIQKLRIFADENGKTNLSIADVGGELLVVSQFTLYADCRKGNRPSFTDAAPPALAEELYAYFIEYAKDKFARVEHGVFGAMMDVELVNSGPFTVIMEDF
ncbi:MAG: D-aminoacyl-tRNA deacylase [Defluviitaleaceae bacterium]|nr:D-aminoacyl-tRNA deacylase [Defluviitaleaceae bacterium]MCL2238376.1 D-aminoacyl-tRNA deacylase [Defluviitaleaceae bacterium]